MPGEVLELLWDPLGAKVAQDAIWTASATPFGGLLGTKIGQDGAKMALCWPTWLLRWPTWPHFGHNTPLAEGLANIT